MLPLIRSLKNRLLLRTNVYYSITDDIKTKQQTKTVVRFLPDILYVGFNNKHHKCFTVYLPTLQIALFALKISSPQRRTKPLKWLIECHKFVCTLSNGFENVVAQLWHSLLWDTVINKTTQHYISIVHIFTADVEGLLWGLIYIYHSHSRRRSIIPLWFELWKEAFKTLGGCTDDSSLIWEKYKVFIYFLLKNIRD